MLLLVLECKCNHRELNWILEQVQYAKFCVYIAAIIAPLFRQAHTGWYTGREDAIPKNPEETSSKLFFKLGEWG